MRSHTALTALVSSLPRGALLAPSPSQVCYAVLETCYFTFILLCIIIDFFLNNQPDALIIPILFCYKTLYVSGIFSAHHQEFSTVHSALVSFMQVSDDCWKRLSEDARNMSSFITE
jgi:hypothetical protein